MVQHVMLIKGIIITELSKKRSWGVERMIDLHCHILPGVDDGAKSLEDSINMAKVAVNSGITHILCTPHHNNGTYRNPKYDVIQHVAALQKSWMIERYL